MQKLTCGMERVVYDYHQGECRDILNTINCLLASRASIVEWTPEELSSWIRSIFFLRNRNDIACRLEREFIDGEQFVKLSEADWLSLDLDPQSFAVLCSITKGFRYQTYNDIPLSGKCSKIGTFLGYFGGLSSPIQTVSDPTSNQQLSDHFFGFLTVLGFKEFRSDGNRWDPIGRNNEVFHLSTRFIRHKQASNTCIRGIDGRMFAVFRVGRQELSCNDIVVHGAVHINKSGRISGPVSRIACSILCSYDPPYECFIFAGSIDDSKCQQKSDIVGKLNDFSTYGVLLWDTKANEWGEVSRSGSVQSLKKSKACFVSNKLSTGSIIDINGVRLLFQSTKIISQVSHVNIVHDLNEKCPTCPVLMDRIEFAYYCPRHRANREKERLIANGSSLMPGLDLKVPIFDYFDVDENKRSYVFPTCGHVFAFHKNLVGRPCPLCRTSGCFVPLALEFQEHISVDFPTHVFNPCGHAASKDCCQFWSNIKVPIYHNSDLRRVYFSACCPFCGVELLPCLNGQLFSKLVIQEDDCFVQKQMPKT